MLESRADIQQTALSFWPIWARLHTSKRSLLQQTGQQVRQHKMQRQSGCEATFQQETDLIGYAKVKKKMSRKEQQAGKSSKPLARTAQGPSCTPRDCLLASAAMECPVR